MYRELDADLMRETIRDYLAADATLMGLLIGGLYAGGEISRQETPGAFDGNGEILPCGLVALETQVPFGPFMHSARQFFTVTCWQREGYEVIDAALARAYDLLEGSKVGQTTDLWTVRHVEDAPDGEDPGLRCAMRYSRYEVIRER